MVEFGKRLTDECAQQGADWQRHCIDYSALKDLIERGGPSAGRDVDADGNDAAAATCLPSRFKVALDREVETAVLFVLKEQGRIASALDDLARDRADLAREASRQRGGRGRAAAHDRLRALHGDCATQAQRVLKLLAFVDLSVTAVRKILKKHDKRTPHGRLTRSYLAASSDASEDTHLDELYSEGGLATLVVSLRRAFLELHRIETELLAGDVFDSQTGKGHRPVASMASLRTGPIHRRIQSTPLFDEPAPGSGEVARVTAEKEPLLWMIQLSRDRLRRSTNTAQDLFAAQALLMFEDEDSAEEPESAPAEMTAAQRVSSFLNLLSTFLYMTNYYVVAPSLGTYLTKLGSPPSMAGLVIGMTPNAALVATVLYCWWSNHSYKAPLIFAAACSLLGNLLYASALHYDSTAFVLMGRALNGFGSARSINRRFIADTFSKTERTAASAAFVSAGALGMACGPALAAICSYFRTSFPPYGLWALETVPGWIMAVMWILQLVGLVFFFEEPDRTHIFGDAAAVAPANGVGEKSCLLAEDAARSGGKESQPSLLSNVPMMVTMWTYFVLKLVLECLMSSCPTLTYECFGWTSGYSGTFLTFLGLLMFPANMLVARLSRRFDDRELIQGSLMAVSCSIVGFSLSIPGLSYSVVHYVFFGTCIFISTNALEGPNMSLLSKSIPKSWAKGIFNAGFLATEAGTLARSVGDIWITCVSHYFGDEIYGIFGGIFVPVLALCAANLALVRKNYDKMVDPDDDDDVKSK